MAGATRSILSKSGALRFFPSPHSSPQDSMAASADSTGRIPELDGLRGLAILSVLFWHYGSYYEPAPGSIGASLTPLLRLGWSGVDLFFVLSGFLIGGILIANRTASNYWRVFYLRRACRIFPLYFAVLAAFALATVMIGPQPSNWLLKQEPPFWNYLLFLQNFGMAWYNSFGSDFLGPTWSLAVEEQFYLVLPFVVLLMRPVALPWVLGGLICLAPMLRSHWLTGDHFLSSYVLMPFRADALLLGVLCAWAVRQPDIARLLERKRSLLFAAFWLLLAGSVALAAQYQFFFHPMMMLVGFTWLALLYATALLLAVSNQESPLKRVLRLPVLRKLGDIAFGVYLLHVPIAGLLHLWIYDAVPKIETPAQFGVTLAAFVLTIIVARASFVFFEKPIIRFGHRFKFSHKQDLPAMAASPQQVT
jgi:peptidoglycan/LPS O-acetylase OafA/YrhL